VVAGPFGIGQHPHQRFGREREHSVSRRRPTIAFRTNQDWIDESSDWIDIHHCNFSVVLAVVDGMLFVATTQNQLWRLDLCPLRLP
jgi:hypothetical protein